MLSSLVRFPPSLRLADVEPRSANAGTSEPELCPLSDMEQVSQHKHGSSNTFIPACTLLPFICPAEAPVAVAERCQGCCRVSKQKTDLCSQMRTSSRINTRVLDVRSQPSHLFLRGSNSACDVCRATSAFIKHRI